MRTKDDFLLDDGSCPACGSADVDVDNVMPPVKCKACGWRGWTPDEEED